MITLIKSIQAFALLIILIGFVSKFPALMDPKLFSLGCAMFVLSWLMQKALQK